MSSLDDAVKEMRELSDADAEWAHYRIHLLSSEPKLAVIRWTVYDNYSPDKYKFVLDEKREPRQFKTVDEARSFLNANAAREHVHPNDLLPEHPSFWKVETVGATLPSTPVPLPPRKSDLFEALVDYGTGGTGTALFSRADIERCLLKPEEKDAVSLALGREIDEERICFASNAYSAWSTRQIEDELRRLSSLVLADHQVRGMAVKLEGLRIALAVRQAREGRTDPISST